MTSTGPEIDGLVFLHHLGEGGYANVYLYERRSPRMKVAVKVLKDGRLTDQEQRQFADEAETMAELSDHPNIVQVFSTEVTSDGRPYLIMKFYPKPNLGARAARERFSVAETLRTGIKIAGAVETAHRAGIVHRDIKPANILVSQYDEPGLTDFGIAGRAADLDDSEDIGLSLPWSAPEVVSAASNGSVQADVYSLAATLWHLLAGRSPFEITGDNGQLALSGRVLHSPPRPTGRGDVPATLERLLTHAMAKDPSTRPRSALEFAQALQSVEQELRFAVTDILVSGLSALPVVRRTDDGDVTRLKPPTRVEAQPVEAPPGRPAPPRRREPAPALANPVTVRRSTPADEAPVELAAPRRRGIRRRTALLAVGAAAIAAVVLGVVLTAGDDSNDNRASSLPSLAATDQTGVPEQVPVPQVRASYTAGSRSLVFVWSVPGAKAGDRYVWARKGADLFDSRPTTATRTTIVTDDPATTCITVGYLPSGAGRPVSQVETCGPAA